MRCFTHAHTPTHIHFPCFCQLPCWSIWCHALVFSMDCVLCWSSVPSQHTHSQDPQTHRYPPIPRRYFSSNTSPALPALRYPIAVLWLISRSPCIAIWSVGLFFFILRLRGAACAQTAPSAYLRHPLPHSCQNDRHCCCNIGITTLRSHPNLRFSKNVDALVSAHSSLRVSTHRWPPIPPHKLPSPELTSKYLAH